VLPTAFNLIRRMDLLIGCRSRLKAFFFTEMQVPWGKKGIEIRKDLLTFNYDYQGLIKRFISVWLA
jgi:hypothetical protein